MLRTFLYDSLSPKITLPHSPFFVFFPRLAGIHMEKLQSTAMKKSLNAFKSSRGLLSTSSTITQATLDRLQSDAIFGPTILEEIVFDTLDGLDNLDDIQPSVKVTSTESASEHLAADSQSSLTNSVYPTETLDILDDLSLGDIDLADF